jgi:voltage-dependent anion channel protein 2
LSSLQGPTFTADTVLGRDGFLLGGEAAYNVSEGRLSRWAAAVGYSAPEYAITVHGLHNLQTFTASYFHKVSPDVEAGAKAVYDTHKAASPHVALEVGGKACVFSLSLFFCCVSMPTLLFFFRN